MSTATLPPPSNSPPLTAADVARLPRTLATTDVDYELHDGRLVVTFPPDVRHARCHVRMMTALCSVEQERGSGQCLGRVGILLRRNPDHLLGTDAAFLTTAQLPPRVSPEGYLLTVPHLIVEVRSKNDTQPEIDEKVRDYL
jgi:Uma2 family endonuclease